MAKSGKSGGGGGADPAGLARDFGYLMPFLDKVAQVSASLPPPAREELGRLLGGEKEKWERIRAVLSGAAPISPTGAARDLTGRAAPSVRAAPDRVRTGFTVGALNKEK